MRDVGYLHVVHFHPNIKKKKEKIIYIGLVLSIILDNPGYCS